MRLKQFCEHPLHLDEILSSKNAIFELKQSLEAGYAFKINHSIDLDLLKKYREYFLKNIDENSEGYTPRTPGCKNYIQNRQMPPQMYAHGHCVICSQALTTSLRASIAGQGCFG